MAKSILNDVNAAFTRSINDAFARMFVERREKWYFE